MLLGSIMGAEMSMSSFRLATCALITDKEPPPVCINRSNTLSGMMNRVLDLLGAEPLPEPRPEPEPKPDPAPEPSPLDKLRKLPAL
jgi:hypothetical protein